MSTVDVDQLRQQLATAAQRPGRDFAQHRRAKEALRREDIRSKECYGCTDRRPEPWEHSVFCTRWHEGRGIGEFSGS